jgi:prephenate dehydrogenase
MTVTVVGIGLIGGSIALDLRAMGFAQELLGVESNPENAAKAIQLGIVDSICDLEEGIHQADFVLIAIPVDTTAVLLPRILDAIQHRAVVTDVGSTKQAICSAVNHHPKRGRFVASHPISGTEHSGPGATLRGLFQNKLCLLCDLEESDSDAVDLVRAMYSTVGMRFMEMDAAGHDRHVAYVSHISHVTSFVLATTVLEMEKSASTIFDLAGSGFESTVRLAKSSPDTWTPIFLQNAPNVCEALEAYIRNLTEFKTMIARSERTTLHATMEKANKIRRILDGMNSQKDRGEHKAKRTIVSERS